MFSESALRAAARRRAYSELTEAIERATVAGAVTQVEIQNDTYQTWADGESIITLTNPRGITLKIEVEL